MAQALVVFSGGQDSTTCLLWALKKFDSVQAIFFDYGQRHKIEVNCARKICQLLKVPLLETPISSLKSVAAHNALMNPDLEIQSGQAGLPNTFVPGRNALFLSLAASYASTQNIDNIVLGVCETDYSGYPDCRQAFIASMQKSLSLAMEKNFGFHTPLMKLNKAQTFQMAAQYAGLELVIKESHTCYEGKRKDLHEWGYGCGKCPACQLRRTGYQDYLMLGQHHA